LECLKTIFLIVPIAAERLALAAMGWSGGSPSKRERLQAAKTLEKRAAHPSSAARLVGRFVLRTQSVD